jgi:hypothetical protein
LASASASSYSSFRPRPVMRAASFAA